MFIRGIILRVGTWSPKYTGLSLQRPFGRRLNMEERRNNVAEILVALESRRYLADIDFLSNSSLHYSTSVASYVLCSYMSLPVKTIIIGERPYATKIHPSISSAMSYDPKKSRPTPSTKGIAADLSNSTDATFIEVESWFRSSWKYLNSGTLVTNCTMFTPFSSSHSLSETVPFQRWIRSILDASLAMSESKIDIICMGIPAVNVVNAILKSMGKDRLRISKKEYPNPAIWSKRKIGDSASRPSTFNRKGTSLAIYSAIKRSRKFIPLTTQNYIDELSREMSAQVPQVGRVLDSGNTLVSELEDAFKELEGNHKMPSVREAYDKFSAALVEYRDSVLKDLVLSQIAAAGDNSSKVGKSTEWGGKKPWKKSAPSVGTSSRMSTVSEDVSGTTNYDDDGIAVKFADEDDEGQQTATETVAEPVKKPKVKKVVKRVVKKKVAPKSTAKGSALDDAAVSALRSCQYYLQENYENKCEEFMANIRDSITSRVAETDHVGLIVDTALADLRTTGTMPDISLGLSDGAISEHCMLPKTMNKLAEKYS